MGKNVGDHPSSLAALETWALAQQHNVTLDLYREDLASRGMPGYAQYCMELRQEDGKDGRDGFHDFRTGFCVPLPQRIDRWLQWLGKQESDAIFVAAHGDFNA